MMKPRSHILIHHSLTRDSGSVSWGAIRRYHTQTNGWSDIGYHAGIEMSGTGGTGHYEILHGRPWDLAGAHCPQQGMNRKSLGVCLVGNFDEMEPPPPQLKLAASFVAWLCRHYDIPTDHVLGHRDFNPAKTCPGTLFNLDLFRNSIENLRTRMDLV